MIIDLLRVIYVLFLITVIGIVVMKIRKPKCTDQEAIKMFIDFIKNIIHECLSSTKEQQSNYPVFIGFNGYDIIPQHVESYFNELNEYFDVFYFDNYNNAYLNRIIYCFKVGNKKVDMEHLDFLELLQKVTEKILIQYFIYHPKRKLQTKYFLLTSNLRRRSV